MFVIKIVARISLIALLMQSISAQPSLQMRRQASLFGLYVADAVASPVHWYYSLAQLK